MDTGIGVPEKDRSLILSAFIGWIKLDREKRVAPDLGCQLQNG